LYTGVDASDGMVRRVRASWGAEDLRGGATGGFAAVVGPHAATVDRIEPFLTLEGLGIAGAHLDR